MHPILFHIFGRPIYSYGVMAALGFLSAILTWQWLGRHENRPPGFAADLGFWLMTSGIIGARAAYVIANWPYYSAHPHRILLITEGGLIFYGGFILAALALILFARRHRHPLWRLADYAIPGLAIGHALGRIGCHLNGCCYGRPLPPLDPATATPTPSLLAPLARLLSTTYPPLCEPGHLYPDTPLYAVQLIEATGLILIWLLLLRAYRRRWPDGTVFALYLILYPPLRFTLEYLRGDPRQTWHTLTIAQTLSLVLFLTGLALLHWRTRPRTPHTPRHPPPTPPRSPVAP